VDLIFYKSTFIIDSHLLCADSVPCLLKINFIFFLLTSHFLSPQSPLCPSLPTQVTLTKAVGNFFSEFIYQLNK
jgi:hypothetical protein